MHLRLSQRVLEGGRRRQREKGAMYLEQLLYLKMLRQRCGALICAVSRCLVHRKEVSDLLSGIVCVKATKPYF